MKRIIITMILCTNIIYAANTFGSDSLWQSITLIAVIANLIIGIVVYKLAWRSFTKDENKKLSIEFSEETSKLETYNQDLEDIIKKKTLELDSIEDEIIEKSKEYTIQNIYNRKTFYKISNVMINIAKRENMPLALMCINITNLQKINDTYGRNVGNELLKTFISLLEFYSRHSDTIARFSGGEFAILLPYTNLEGGEKFASKLKNIAHKQTITVEGESIKFNVNISVEPVDIKSDTLIHEVVKRVEYTTFLANKP